MAHSEAAFSATARLVDENGVSWLLTFRDGVTLEEARKAWAVATTVTAGLIEHGMAPEGNGHSNEAANGNGNGKAEVKADPSWCPIHSVTMGKHEKNGATWYSHKAGDAWCRGK